MNKQLTKSNQGAVLIFILGIAATLSAILIMMQASAIQDVKRIQGFLDETEAYYLTQSGHQLTQRLLMQDLSNNNIDTALDNWAALETPRTYPLADGTIQLQITDEGAIPNINQLYTGLDVRDPYFKDTLKRYARLIDLDDDFIPVAIDWIDPNDSAQVGGAEKSKYIYKTPPYTPENKRIFSMEDMKLLHEYKPKDYLKFEDYFTVLPFVAKININTMSYEFMQAAFNNVSASKLTAFNKKRRKEPFEHLHEAYSELGITTDEAPKSIELDVRSRFFKLTSRASIHGIERAFEILYDRNGGKLTIRRFQWL